MNRRRRFLIIAALMMAATVPAADAAYLLLKAELAQHLIAQAWDETTAPLYSDSHHRQIKPWPWADTYPVARLKIDDLQLDTWVLNGSSGTSLAFGPGMNEGSATIGTNGLVVIGAHRDTHFKNLHRIKLGQTIQLQDTKRQWHTYRVTHIGVADSRIDTLAVIEEAAHLALVTCYPFNTLTIGGPLRYVVEAQIIDSQAVHYQ